MLITYLFITTLLFYILSRAASYVVSKIKEIAEKFNINILSLGMVLGLLTTLPEFFVGVNSMVSDIPDLSFGNLIGGIIVILCLVLGFSLVLNRQVKTDGKDSSILPIVFYVALPLILGLKGYLNYVDGILLILIYVFFLYRQRGSLAENTDIPKGKDNINLPKNFTGIIVGTIVIISSSSLIVHLTSQILKEFNISAFVVGLILFSVGTNLPEIIITIQSWIKNVPELSISHLFGSALANILVLGFFVSIKTINIEINSSYYFLVFSFFVILFSFYKFYKSDMSLTRKEGFQLLLFYLFFVLGQICFSL